MSGSAPKVEVKLNEAGYFVLGATIDGVFVDFVKLGPDHVAGVIAKAKAQTESSSSTSSEEE